MIGGLVICFVEGCTKEAKKRGRCVGHYSQWRLSPDFIPSPDASRHGLIDRKCSLPGCSAKHDSHGFCRLHAKQYTYYKNREVVLEQAKKRYRPERKKVEMSAHKRALAGRVWYHTNGQKPEHRFKKAQTYAKKHAIPWDIDLETYRALVSVPCTYCNCDYPNGGSGLDRLDNNLGYINGNVVPCCPFCNLLKSDFLSSEEIKQVVDLLKNLRGKDRIWDGFRWGATKRFGTLKDEQDLMDRYQNRKKLQTVFLDAAKLEEESKKSE